MIASRTGIGAFTSRRAPEVRAGPARFRCGTLDDAGTPYDLGFVPGEHVHIQDRNGFSIVQNQSQLRWVTPYQVAAYIAPGPGATSPPYPPLRDTERGNKNTSLGLSRRSERGGCDADPARQYLELRAALLASPAGYLDDLIEVRPRPLPAQVPSTYKGCPIVMSDTSPVTQISGWMGEHVYSPAPFTGRVPGGGVGRGSGGGVPTIYIETEYVEAILDRHRYDILWATFRHERFESRCELALARAEFPTARPRQLGGLAICMNGLAHKMTLRLLGEAAGERQYNDMLDRQREELGLGRV